MIVNNQLIRKRNLAKIIDQRFAGSVDLFAKAVDGPAGTFEQKFTVLNYLIYS